MKQKTISGARAKKGQRSDGCNPRHNNRDYLPSNADPERQHLNEYYAESTTDVTIEQIYDRLFQPAYEEWLAKEHAKGRQKDAPATYLEKIEQAKDGKRVQYEIIWQIGDRNNTGWDSDREDFERARLLLHDFAGHLQQLPNVAIVTPELLQNPNWQPPFDDGLIITNMALHGDEKTPQIHMDFIPYTRSKRRGQAVQNAYAAAFDGMGYPVVEQPDCDPETGELLYKRDTDGNVLLNKKGEPIPVMRKTAFGSIDWIEEQKGWIQEQMRQRYGWEREYKGRNPFGDVTLSEYAVEDNARTIREQEKEMAAAEQRLATISTAINQKIDGMERSVDSYLQGLAEDVVSDPDNVYDDALFFMQNCDDEQFQELSDKGRELKKEILPEKILASADGQKQSLDQVIREIAAGKAVAKPLSWQERQEKWTAYGEMSKQFWAVRADMKQEYQAGLDAAYQKRRDAMRSYYDAMYFLRRSRGFVSMIIATIWAMSAMRKEQEINRQIEQLRSKRDTLVRNTASFAKFSREYRDDLKAGKMPCEDYMEAMADVIRSLDQEHQQFQKHRRQEPELRQPDDKATEKSSTDYIERLKQQKRRELGLVDPGDR